MNAAASTRSRSTSAPPRSGCLPGLTTGADFAAWWAPTAGSAAEGGELRVNFAGIADPLVLRVAQAKRPSTVTWDVRQCSFQSDWVGASAAVTLGASGDRTEPTSCVAVDSSTARSSRG